MNQLALKPNATAVKVDDRKLGKQLTDQYHRATDGMVEYLAFGALAMNVQELVDSARGANSPQRGPETKGTGLKGWLKTYAPEITEPTAYRYIEMADGVKAEFKLGPRSDLYAILKGDKPEPKQLVLRDKISGFVDGKSQRQLLVSFGKYDAKTGGKRDAKTKPPTEAERRAAWLEDARQRSIATFSGLHDLEQRWKILDDAQLAVAVSDAEAFLKDAKAWLKTPPPARAALDVEKLLHAADAADQGGKQS
ncbi:MAG: hypothetical protein HY302_09260 [Opitutae bacterium]|nr:hypothetical protein [Opitutae bacterium]